MSGRRYRIVLLVVLVVLAVPASAAAWPGSSTNSIVSLGDSYISGEAGRWQGNSVNDAGDRDGTDRAAVCTTPVTCTYDPSKTYLNHSDTDGCHKSDVAEILSANLPTDLQLNLACSGAVTANIYRSSNGGQSFKGKAPQADQLGFIARATRVKGIVLSIGGNDLGFADIVQACLTAYLSHSAPCNTTQDHPFRQQFVGVLGKIDKAIKEIRRTMLANGYQNTPYRLIVQSYPSVLPRSSENRYADENDPLRAGAGGCPFYDDDSDWARDDIVYLISAGVRAVALANNAQFLNLSDAFQGREFCSTSSKLVGVGGTPAPPDSSTNEWGRFVNQASITQGETQELFHPNAFGQQALGRCLTLLWQETGPEYACTNQAGQGFNGMQLAPPG